MAKHRKILLVKEGPVITFSFDDDGTSPIRVEAMPVELARSLLSCLTSLIAGRANRRTATTKPIGITRPEEVQPLLAPHYTPNRVG